MAKYKLAEFTDSLFNTTKAAWSNLVDDDAYEIEVLTQLQWVESHLVQKDHDSFAMALVNNDSDNVDAIVEIVSSKKGAMVKLLRVILSPEFWDITSKRDDVINIYLDVFFNFIAANAIQSGSKVKIYGRTDEMMSLLRSIHSNWNVQGGVADFEGRFLTVVFKK